MEALKPVGGGTITFKKMVNKSITSDERGC